MNYDVPFSVSCQLPAPVQVSCHVVTYLAEHHTSVTFTHMPRSIAQQRDTRTIDDDEVAVLSPPSYRYLHLTDSLLTIAPHKALKASFVWKSPFRADLFAVLIKIQENQSQPNDMKKIQGYHEDLQQKRTSLSGPCTVLVRTSQSLSQEQTTITAD